MNGCGGGSRPAPCPDGAICAAWAPFTAQELVHAPEVCHEELAALLTTNHSHADGTVAIEVVPWAADPARQRVTTTALERALTGFALELAKHQLRLIAIVHATDPQDGCGAQDIRDLALVLADHGGAGPRKDRSLGAGGARSRVELFCRPTREAGTAGRRDALLWRVLPPGADRAQCHRARADHTCTEGALVDLGVSGMAAASRAARAAGATVGGFVWSPGTGTHALRNESFALGFAAWETSGPVALRMHDGARPDRCAPLLAQLAAGASLSQVPGAPPGTPLRRPDREIELAIDLEPARTERRISVSYGAFDTELPITAGETELRASLPAPRDARALVLTVPPDGNSLVRLRSVRLDDGMEEKRSARSARRERALRWLNAQGPSIDAAGQSRDEPLRLVDALDDARVRSSDEDFVRVEPFGSNDPSLQSGILAHPGTDEPTQIEFTVPAFACPRRFTTHVTIAPDCRSSSDGVLFRARSGDATASLLVGGQGRPAKALVELQLDEPHDAQASLSERSLTLETESGPSHEARCDWAIWAEPTIACSDAFGAATDAETARRSRTIEIPEGTGSAITTSWDEINVWKLYAFFGPMGAKARRIAQEPGWLVRRLPWLTHVRVLAALGGNSCHHIRQTCERSERTTDHPFDPPCWEGHGGRAAAYELLHDENPPRIDTSAWGAALDDVLNSGVKPHLNLSAAPCLLTGGEHSYRDYHWNQVPVADHRGYDDLLRTFAGEVQRRGAGPDWRFSIVNEPNCLWIAPPERSYGLAPAEATHIGFLGDATTYATQFSSTARLLRELIPGIRLQIGNFTIGGKYPLEDNLAEYLGVLAPALEQAGVPASELSAISFSIYESPQHGLGDLPAYKFGIVDRARKQGSPFRDLPIKLDEVEIHPLVVRQFNEDTAGDLDATRWAAAWHADMMAMAIETGVRSLAPWLGRLIPDDDLEHPLPKYWAYALLSLATGQAVAPDGPLAAANELRAPAARGGEASPRILSLRRASDDRDGLGWLVTREPRTGVTWIALWRHGHEPITDAAADEPPLLDVTITRPGRTPLSPAGTTVEVLSLGPVSPADGGAQQGEPSDARPWSLAPFRSTAVRSWQTTVLPDGVHLSLGKESVALLRLTPDHPTDGAPPPPSRSPDDTRPDLAEPT